MNLIRNGNIALAFLLELYAIFILGYWGFSLQANQIIRMTFGLLAPISMMIIWSVLCAPSSSYRLQGLWLFLTKCLLFGIALYCLFSMKQITAAVIFGIFICINLGLSSYFKTL